MTFWLIVALMTQKCHDDWQLRIADKTEKRMILFYDEPPRFAIRDPKTKEYPQAFGQMVGGQGGYSIGVWTRGNKPEFQVIDGVECYEVSMSSQPWSGARP